MFISVLFVSSFFLLQRFFLVVIVIVYPRTPKSLLSIIILAQNFLLHCCIKIGTKKFSVAVVLFCLPLVIRFLFFFSASFWLADENTGWILVIWASFFRWQYSFFSQQKKFFVFFFYSEYWILCSKFCLVILLLGLLLVCFVTAIFVLKMSVFVCLRVRLCLCLCVFVLDGVGEVSCKRLFVYFVIDDVMPMEVVDGISGSKNARKVFCFSKSFDFFLKYIYSLYRSLLLFKGKIEVLRKKLKKKE